MMQRTINTVAGNGERGGASGDRDPATGVSLLFLWGLAVDGSSNLFIAETANHRIRRVDAATGVITTVAGRWAGFSGDGGLATRASLNNPTGVAVDGSGNLYIADVKSHRIRRVDAASGVITTVARDGTRGLSGDGDPATSVSLVYPEGLAVDGAGNLYIAEEGRHRIRRVDAATGVITTVAGNGGGGFLGDGGPATDASLSSLWGVAVDGSGNLYIAESGSNPIRRVDAATGVITTVAGDGAEGFWGDGGPATIATLHLPRGLAVDGSGNLFIADTRNHRIRRVDAVSGVITTVSGNAEWGGFSGDGGPAASANLHSPIGLAIDGSGNLLVADAGNHRVRRIVGVVGAEYIPPKGETGELAAEAAPVAPVKIPVTDPPAEADAETPVTPGNINTVAGNGGTRFSGDGGPATDANLFSVNSIVVDDSGNLYISVRVDHSVRRVDAASGVITTVAGNGERGFSGDGGPATRARVNQPFGIAVDGSGNLYIADKLNQRVRWVDVDSGVIATVAGNGLEDFSGDGGPATDAQLNTPTGVAVDGAGNLLIADTLNHRVRPVDARTGVITTVVGNGTEDFSGDRGPATSASLRFPVGVAVDGSGNLYIADQANRRIRRVDAATGVITTVAGNGEDGFSGDGGPATDASLSSFWGVAVDDSGNLYIADMGNHRVRRVDAAGGVINTVAGKGTEGFSGDRGPATSASVDSPIGLAVDGAGNLLIADSGNHRVRQIAGVAGAESVPPEGEPGA